MHIDYRPFKIVRRVCLRSDHLGWVNFGLGHFGVKSFSVSIGFGRLEEISHKKDQYSVFKVPTKK